MIKSTTKWQPQWIKGYHITLVILNLCANILYVTMFDRWGCHLLGVLGISPRVVEAIVVHLDSLFSPFSFHLKYCSLGVGQM